MAQLEPLNYLWQDRKRILGMPISFTKYSLTADRIFRASGLFNLREDEVILYRVRDLSVRISLGQRIFGVGTVILQTSDHSTPTLELQNIRQPREVKELLHKQVEEMKISRKMRVGELLEDDACGQDHPESL